MRSIGVRLAFLAVLIICIGTDWSRPARLFAGETSEGRSEKGLGYTGTSSCRKCHEKFYKLWAPSHHGLAMQPYTKDFAKKSLTPQKRDISVGAYRYRADIEGDKGAVLEAGPDGGKKYPIVHALGGKNIYYFLTPMERGRLQTLPVAYDVRKKEWFDTAKSGVRHFPGRSDEPVNWKEWPYTFNTACYSCHVSQLSTNYDPATDTYKTTWREPGINCETCHGPGEEHVRVCEAAPKGTVPKDLKTTRGGRDFTNEQNNDTCSSCHAKAMPLTASFMPGDRFFDHFDLTTLENPDFYPDGRDLGENYTFTTWRMSPCVKAGNLNCLFCHTSSGRYRHKDNPNESCRECHQERFENVTAHTRHKADSPGNMCIACHMPTTEFARMRRSDHSMLPPTPSATIAFKSPNACNNCHKDKTPEWADELVRAWHEKDYQGPVLHRAGLIEAARKRDWTRLPEMSAYIESRDRDEVFATSLLRLLMACGDSAKWPTMIKAIKDRSPLVRSAAAEALKDVPQREAVQALIEATSDEYRLVRVRAAASLAGYRNRAVDDADRERIEAAVKEHLDSLLTRQDQWNSHFNLGNYYLDQGELNRAIQAYDTALKLEPRSVLAGVNRAMAYSRMGDNAAAHDSLRKALEIAPEDAAANFNMGLLLAEENDPNGAEKLLRTALKSDPGMAQAAYNLSVILSKDRLEEAEKFCRKAAETRPDVPKYAFALAYYQLRKGDESEAARSLEDIIRRRPDFGDAYVFLGRIYENLGKRAHAIDVYERALSVESVPVIHKLRVKARLQSLQDGSSQKQAQ